MVANTCSGVSTASLATSITPTITSLSLSSPISDSGTWLLAHSSETWLILDALIAGKIASYCRHSLPSDFFQSILAWMP